MKLYSAAAVLLIGLMFFGLAWCSLRALDQTAANHLNQTAVRLEALNSQDLSR